MPRIALPLAALCLALSAAVWRARAADPSPPRAVAGAERSCEASPAEDSAVYEAALAQAVAEYPDTATIAVQRRTLSPAEFTLVEDPVIRLSTVHRPKLPGLAAEAERCVWVRNGRSDSLPGGLRIGRRVDWVDVPRGHRDGVLAYFVLSRPGYSADTSQALLYVAFACPLCGRGEYVLLRRSVGRWVVSGRSEDWIS